MGSGTCCVSLRNRDRGSDSDRFVGFLASITVLFRIGKKGIDVGIGTGLGELNLQEQRHHGGTILAADRCDKFIQQAGDHKPLVNGHPVIVKVSRGRIRNLSDSCGTPLGLATRFRCGGRPSGGTSLFRACRKSVAIQISSRWSRPASIPKGRFPSSWICSSGTGTSFTSMPLGPTRTVRNWLRGHSRRFDATVPSAIPSNCPRQSPRRPPAFPSSEPRPALQLQIPKTRSSRQANSRCRRVLHLAAIPTTPNSIVKQPIPMHQMMPNRTSPALPFQIPSGGTRSVMPSGKVSTWTLLPGGWSKTCGSQPSRTSSEASATMA